MRRDILEARVRRIESKHFPEAEIDLSTRDLASIRDGSAVIVRVGALPVRVRKMIDHRSLLREVFSMPPPRRITPPDPAEPKAETAPEPKADETAPVPEPRRVRSDPSRAVMKPRPKRRAKVLDPLGLGLDHVLFRKSRAE